jgi:hypothetical protein
VRGKSSARGGEVGTGAGTVTVDGEAE